MKNLQYDILIDACPEKVWNSVFGQDENKNWPGAIDEGTYFEGDWSENSIMRFLDSENNGMFNRIEICQPFEKLKMLQVGWILDGELSPQNWGDSTIIYLFEPKDNGTLLKCEVNSPDEFVDFFNSKYPANFQKIKRLAEHI